MRRSRRILVAVLGGLLVLCLLAATVSALINRSLFEQYNVTGTPASAPERLSDADKLRLSEALQLKKALGDQVWPGWGQADIPVILWASGTEFLTGVSEAPKNGATGDDPWQEVSGDMFAGEPYFRQVSDNPQNFATDLGGTWAASIATKEETDRFLIGQFRSMMPGPLKAVFPYRLLILPSEVQMTGALHETFHAYQATVVPQRLQEAERAHRLGDQYWAADANMHDDWSKEIDLLVRAVKAKSDEEARGLAEQFLTQRQQRRTAVNLGANLVDYECQLEWEEGLAKYVELAVWKQASSTPGYHPQPGLAAADPSFKGYHTFEKRLGDELGTLRRSATQEEETRFYYTGMAQGMLLDRLAPGWQARALNGAACLEDLWNRERSDG